MNGFKCKATAAAPSGGRISASQQIGETAGSEKSISEDVESSHLRLVGSVIEGRLLSGPDASKSDHLFRLRNPNYACSIF
jgi:hypothetical protein